MDNIKIYKKYFIQKNITTKNIILAVYGTLKKNKKNHYMIIKNNGNFLQKINVPNLQMYSLGDIPCVVKGNNIIKMELYLFKSNKLKIFDYFENGNETPKDFPRKIIGKYNNIPIYIYMYNNSISGYKQIKKW